MEEQSRGVSVERQSLRPRWIGLIVFGLAARRPLSDEERHLLGRLRA